VTDDTATFETHRPALLALAYRMLGEMARAEDMVQDAWVRWQRRSAAVDAPKAFLITTVTRLCLDELGSARVRHEEARGDRLPEPVDLEKAGIGRVEMSDQISMAFLVLLQRLTPAERAVLLLHDVFDMSHAEIGALLGKKAEACRQLLKRARENVAVERRVFETSQEEHERLLIAFVQALTDGDQAGLNAILAEDAVLIVDPGPGSTRFGRLRNIGRPVVGRHRIAALIKAFTATLDGSSRLEFSRRTLNGGPAAIAFLNGRALSALFVSVAEGRIRHLFFQSDPDRLRHVTSARAC
jgi:RNA polymerase sigma-70 factor (ECF subfamily)